jgi:hypothetical protein
MKLVFLSLTYILSHAFVATAQLAIINDPDGFTNVRAGSSANSKIIGKFNDGDVFSYDDEKNEWVKVGYYPADSSNRVYFEGYIHKDRLLPIDQLYCILKNHKTVTNGHLTLHKDSLTVEFMITPFRPAQHLLRKENDWIQKIDGKRPLGTDGEMPVEKLTRLRVVIGDHAVAIPAAAWDNLYDPTFETCNVLVDARTGFMYIDLVSDRSAAGGYEIVWIFKNDRYIKRYVDQSNN